MKAKIPTAITRFVQTALGRVQYLVFAPRRNPVRVKRIPLRRPRLAGAPGK